MADILPFLKNQAVFDPEATLAMSEAFEQVCRALKLDGDTWAREAIAKRIVELARRGELDPIRLRESVLLEANRGKSA